MEPATGSSGNARHIADTSGELEASEHLSVTPSDPTRADALAHARAREHESVDPEPAELVHPEPTEILPVEPETAETPEPAPVVVPVQSPAEADEPISLEAQEKDVAETSPEMVVSEEKTPSRARPFALLHFNRLAVLITGAILAAVLLLAGAGTVLFNRNHDASPENGGSGYAAGKLSLGNIQPSDSLEVGNASQLSVNGQLKVNDSLVLVPTTTPTSPVAGQFYYNKADNSAYFYNGTQFVNLAPVHVSSIGGQAGAITLDSSLQITNNNLGISSQLLQQIANAGDNGGPRVTSLQGLSGAVTLNGGSGITINGTTISNSGLISLTSGSGNLVIGDDGAGHYTITDTGGGGSVTSLTGTPNQVNVSSSTGNVTLSLPQDIAVGSAPTFGGLTVTGDMAVQGAGGLTLGSGAANGKLTFSSSGGGSIALQSGSMATNLAFTLPSVDGSNGYCLKTNGGGTLSFQQCTGGPGGGVSSLNNQTDIVVLNNATGSGGFITIDNAKADGATKGIATFNATNFSDNGSGVINTVQDISTTASPTFGGLTVNGTATATTLNAASVIQLNGTDINLAGTLNNVAYLNGTGPQIFSGNNKFTGTVTAQLTSPTAFQVQDGLGTSNLFVANTSTDRVGIGTLGPGYKLDVQGGDINTGGIYRVNGAQISSANLSNDSNLAKLNGANVFSAANTFSDKVSIQGANSLTLGSGTNIGSIIFRDGSSANTGTLQLQGVLSGNVTYSLPTATGSQTVCTIETGNCAGSGTGITGSGTTNKLAKFTGSQAIGDSSISDDGTVVTVSTGQIVQGAAGLTIGSMGIDGKIVLTNSINNNTLTLQSGATTGNLTLTLPTADGSNGNCLKTNGSGVLSFAACTGGPGGGVTSINTLTGPLNIVGTANQVSVSSAGDTITLSLPQDINTGGNANFRTVTLTGQAAGDNLIVGNAVSGATGNLIDLKVNNVSQFTVTPNGNVNTVGQYQVNGVQIASSNLSDGNNLAKLNGTGPQVFTGDNQFTGTTQVKLDSPAAFSIENSTGSSHLLVADTTTSRIGIGTNSPSYPLDVNGDVNTSGVYRINGVTVCSATGCSPASGSTSYIWNGTSAQTANFNITGTGVIGTSLTTPSVTSTGALSVQAGGTNSALTLDSSGTGAVTLGTGANSKAVTIGNTTGSTQVNIQSGNGNAGGDINVGNAALASGTRLINIGATASTTASSTINIGTSNSLTNSQNINIGTNVAGNSSVLIQAGTTGSIGLQVGAGGTINVGTLTNNVLNLGTGAVAGAIKIGGTAQTGTLTVGQSAATNTISIGSAAGNGNTQTINIGTSATAGSTTNLTLGSTIAGTLTLQGATVKQTVTGGSVTIQNITNNSTTAFQIQNTSGGNLFVADTQNSRVGVNTGALALNTNFNVYNGGASTIQTQFTQNLRDAGINVMSDYIQDAYTSGLFWSTQNNNPTSPKAGIYTQLTNNGSKLLFGTSKSYAAGLTNTALTLGYNGEAIFRNSDDTNVGFQVQDHSGNGLLTVNTATGATLTSSLYVDILGSGGTTALCWNGSLQVSSCASTGSIGFWNRTGTTLQPAATGDDITTSGNILTTGTGGITSAGDFVANGTALFRNSSDSPAAFQIQQSDSTPLFTADTAVAAVKVAGDLSVSTRDGLTNLLTVTSDTFTQDVSALQGVLIAHHAAGLGNQVQSTADLLVGSSENPQNMTVFSDGFESGNFNLWDSTTGSVAVTHDAYNSGYGFNISVNGSPIEVRKHIGSFTQSDVTAYVLLGTRPASGAVNLLNFYSSTGTRYSAYMQSDGTVCVYNGTTTATSCGSFPVSNADGWVRLELFVGIDSSAGYVGVNYTEDNGAGGSAEIDGNTGTDPITQVGAGDPLGTGLGSGMALDDVMVGVGDLTPSAQIGGNLYVGGSSILKNQLLVQNSSGSSIFRVDANNNKVTVSAATDSANLFQVQNASGASLLNVDSVNSNITLLGNDSGAVGPWQTASNALPAIRNVATSVVANGYVYEIGGSSGTPQSTVYYAKLNSDGSVGTWTTATNALPTTVYQATSVASNGYVYVMGGVGSSTVYYAKLNSDGSVGTWKTASNALPGNRQQATSVVANGYVYVLGGSNGTIQSTVYYAKLNSDGSVGTWNTAANALPGARSVASSVTANGYVYVIGGSSGTPQSTVYYAKLNSDGSVGTWTTAGNALPATRTFATSVVSNGYVYEIGGSNSSFVPQSTVYYAKLNSDGSVGTWTTAANALPDARINATSVTANGYIYEVGGTNASGTVQSTVYYTSTPRLQVGGSLDLVGLQGSNLADGDSQGLGSVGGNLTAGDTNIVGTLQVQGAANFSQSVAINGTLNVGNNVAVTTTSTQAFQVQNSGGTNLLSADTTNMTLNVTGTLNAQGIAGAGGTTPTVIGGGSTTSSSATSKTVTTNASTQTGDLVIIEGYMEPANEQTSSATYGTIAVPTGVTALPGFPINTDDNNITTVKTHRLYIWYYYATASGAQNLTFTDSQNVYWGLTATTIRGGPTSGNPLADPASTATISSGASGVTTSPPVSLNLGGTNSLVLWAYGDWAGPNPSYPTGYTDVAHSSNETGQPAIAQQNYAAAGSTGTITATRSGNRNGMSAALLSFRAGSASNIMNLKNSGGSTVGSVDSSGNLTLQGASSMTALQVKDSYGVSVLGVDTANHVLNVGGDLTVNSNSEAALHQIIFKDTAFGAQWRVGDTSDGVNSPTGLQGGYSLETQLYSYWGIVLSGNRQSTGTPAFFSDGTHDADVTIQGSGNATNALQVLNSSSVPLLSVNTDFNHVNVSGPGSNGGGGRLTFGDFNPTTDNAAWVGEWGSSDTDALQVNGEQGIYLTSGSYTAPEVVGKFTYDSGRDSGVLQLGNTTSGGYLEFDNNAAFKWSIGMDSFNGCSGSTPADTLYFYSNVAGGCALQFTSAGNATFKSATGNSVFQIQNSGGNPLFNVNSNSNAITLFSGVTGGTLTTDIAGTKTSNAVCHSGGAGANENVQIVACTGSIIADYAEKYPVASGTDYGDIVVTGSQMVDTYNADGDGNADWSSVKGQVTQLVKSSAPYQTNTIGIVSDNYNNFTSAGNNIKDEDNPMPVALNGRVPVNVAPGSGAIQPGDYLTTSGDSGKAMKATQGGFVIGKALEAWDPASGKTQVMVFVEPGYWPGPTQADYLQNGGNATLANLNVSGTATINDLTVTGAATIAELTVTGSAQFAGNITVGGHIITAGGQPTSQTETAAGTAATVSVDGTDTTGTITITTGAAPTAGDLAKILFSQTYGKAPHVVLSASNDKAAGLHFYKGATTATDFMFTSLDAPAPNTTYTFDYVIAQ